MFREMLRKKQELSKEECIEILKNEMRGVLAVLGDDDYPYGVPINHWYCEEDGKLYNCPIFDNGATLLSDTRIDYPLDENVLEMIPKVKSKTITKDFEEQLTALEINCISDIEFYYTDKDILELLNSIEEYDEQIKNRVIRILISQRQKYSGYFS